MPVLVEGVFFGLIGGGEGEGSVAGRVMEVCNDVEGERVCCYDL